MKIREFFALGNTSQSSSRVKSHSSKVERLSRTTANSRREIRNSTNHNESTRFSKLRFSEEPTGTNIKRYRRGQPSSVSRGADASKWYRTPLEDCCVECGNANISVTYYGQRHLCVPCRSELTDDCSRPVKLFLDSKSERVVLALLPKESGPKEYIPVDPTHLYLGKRPYHATYAGSC